MADKLFPPCVRYKLAWHLAAGNGEGDGQFYGWQPIPPDRSFVALGCVATTTDEPPPFGAARCVPVEWTKPADDGDVIGAAETAPKAPPAEAPGLVFTNASLGGKRGGLWRDPLTGLLLVNAGAEPPSDPPRRVFASTLFERASFCDALSRRRGADEEVEDIRDSMDLDVLSMSMSRASGEGGGGGGNGAVADDYQVIFDSSSPLGLVFGGASGMVVEEVAPGGQGQVNKVVVGTELTEVDGCEAECLDDLTDSLDRRPFVVLTFRTVVKGAAGEAKAKAKPPPPPGKPKSPPPQKPQAGAEEGGGGGMDLLGLTAPAPPADPFAAMDGGAGAPVAAAGGTADLLGGLGEVAAPAVAAPGLMSDWSPAPSGGGGGSGGGEDLMNMNSPPKPVPDAGGAIGGAGGDPFAGL